MGKPKYKHRHQAQEQRRKIFKDSKFKTKLAWSKEISTIWNSPKRTHIFKGVLEQCGKSWKLN